MGALGVQKNSAASAMSGSSGATVAANRQQQQKQEQERQQRQQQQHRSGQGQQRRPRPSSSIVLLLLLSLLAMLAASSFVRGSHTTSAEEEQEQQLQLQLQQEREQATDFHANTDCSSESEVCRNQSRQEHQQEQQQKQQNAQEEQQRQQQQHHHQQHQQQQEEQHDQHQHQHQHQQQHQEQQQEQKHEQASPSACCSALDDSEEPQSQQRGLEGISDEELRGGEKLVLKGRNLQPEDIMSMIPAISNNSALTELHLGNNNVGNTAAVFLLHGLVRAAQDPVRQRLRVLSLPHCHLGNAASEAIANALLRLPALETVQVQDNMIGDAGCSVFAAILVQNTSLRELHFCSNPLTQEGISRLQAAEAKYPQAKVHLNRDSCSQ